jgi:ribosomal protein S18 acetylase RimI-like enzyme
MVNYRPASIKDIPALTRLFTTSPRLHRHLDWHPPIDWVGSQPIYLAENNDDLLASLGLPADPPNIAWIRFYACALSVPVIDHWHELLDCCVSVYPRNNPPLIPALGLSEWFSSLLSESNFEIYQHIVGLSREVLHPLPPEHINKVIFIRPMDPEDLGDVAEIDQEAFEPIWQNSYDQIQQALLVSSYATVAELDDRIVGFQISTANMFSAHLARLAVRPTLRGHRIGYTLVAELIEKSQRDRLWQVTVNTQDNNKASLALYRLAGFESTGEEYPVYLYNWSK